jgi:hypothetical protein
LREHIDLEFDVVRGRGVNDPRLIEMGAEQLAGGAGGFEGRCERSDHPANLTDCAPSPRKIFHTEKKREEK